MNRRIKNGCLDDMIVFSLSKKAAIDMSWGRADIRISCPGRQLRRDGLGRRTDYEAENYAYGPGVNMICSVHGYQTSEPQREKTSSERHDYQSCQDKLTPPSMMNY